MNPAMIHFGGQETNQHFDWKKGGFPLQIGSYFHNTNCNRSEYNIK